jgi:hypothetical protein
VPDEAASGTDEQHMVAALLASQGFSIPPDELKIISGIYDSWRAAVNELYFPAAAATAPTSFAANFGETPTTCPLHLPSRPTSQ